MRYFKFVTADGCSKILPDHVLAAPPPEYILPLTYPPKMSDLAVVNGPVLKLRVYDYHKTIDGEDGDAIVIYREREPR